jgi:ubiquinone/menaquinone biosynthesis C-methylase UbiE
MSQIDHFDRVASRYDELRGPTGFTPLHETLAREGRLAGAEVLDVGCGTGGHAQIMAGRFGCRISGVDPSRQMLEVARRRLPDADWRVGTAERLPYSGGLFDAALMLLVVHHVDRPAAFPEIHRVLRRTGRLLISTPDPAAFPRAWMAPLFPSYVSIEQGRFPTAKVLEQDLRLAGFGAVRTLPFQVPRSFDREYAVERIRGRYASTFDLMGEEEYAEGLERAQHELPDTVQYVLEMLIVVAEHD